MFPCLDNQLSRASVTRKEAVHCHLCIIIYVLHLVLSWFWIFGWWRNVLDLLKKRKQKGGLVDIIMGPAYYNILKYQRSLIWHEGGNPALRARHFGLALLGVRVFW